MSQHRQQKSNETRELTNREILALIQYLDPDNLDPDRDRDEQVPSWVVICATLAVLFALYAGILWLDHWIFKS
jgi:hypothetical protein